jgi:hypothetical protein
MPLQRSTELAVRLPYHVLVFQIHQLLVRVNAVLAAAARLAASEYCQAKQHGVSRAAV